MATNDRMWAGTRNGDYHFGRLYEEVKLQAAGYDWKAGDHQKKFNGGITAPIETRLQKDDKIYRFAGSRQTKLEDQIRGSPLGRGSWWFDYETCLFLWSKCKDRSDEGFRNAARSAFAVLHDWSDMNYCVAGVLAYDFWSIYGNTAPAKRENEFAINPYGFVPRQIFIPGHLTPDDFKIIRPVGLTRVVY
jgi:hypothetical protein